ncbi:MAG: hypothetical protein DLM50_03495 [Candidatus Meridianibacter frigidus]|nr:MAG: hypothetical protein DLM50_03495 [Candidatus Eremiobacteraeota bacterium]
MIRAGAGLTAMLCASLFLFESPADATVERTVLPFGSTLIAAPNPNVATATVELWFRAPSTGYGHPVAGLARYAALAVAASKGASGSTLSQSVKDLGGTFSISVYPDALAVAASVPATADAAVLRSMTAAYFTPQLTNDGLRAGLRDAVVAATQKSFDPQVTLRDAIFAAIFSEGPAHYPTLPENIVALSTLSAQDVRAFASRAFRSSNAVVSLAGNLSANPASAVRGGRVDGQPAAAPVESLLFGAPQSVRGSFGEDAIGLGWRGPPISDARACTAMDFLSDYLFRDETGVVARVAAARYPDAYFSGQYITLHDPGVMLVAIAGKNDVSISTAALESVVRAQTPLEPSVFAAARTAFIYHILADTESPADAADNFGWYAVEGDPAYAPSDDAGKYVQLAGSLDPQYVAQIAKRYLVTPTVVTLTASGK